MVTLYKTKTINMKLLLALTVIGTIAVLVIGEGCQTGTDCSNTDHVQCPEQDYERHCVRGMCTCTQVGSSCVSLNDCQQDACPHKGDEHCIDGQCRCGLFPHGNSGNHGNHGPQVLVHGEGCQTDTDCSNTDHVVCPEKDYERHCVQGMCTCTQVGSSCISLNDCQQDACPHKEDEHCIDGQCRCGLFSHGNNGNHGNHGPQGR